MEITSLQQVYFYERFYNFTFLGTYKPTLKCFDLNEMSLKFERGLDADVVKFQLLSDDYTKVRHFFYLKYVLTL
jgi:ribosome biogenesis protein ENP2